MQGTSGNPHAAEFHWHHHHRGDHPRRIGRDQPLAEHLLCQTQNPDSPLPKTGQGTAGLGRARRVGAEPGGARRGKAGAGARQGGAARPGGDFLFRPPQKNEDTHPGCIPRNTNSGSPIPGCLAWKGFARTNHRLPIGQLPRTKSGRGPGDKPLVNPSSCSSNQFT